MKVAVSPENYLAANDRLVPLASTCKLGMRENNCQFIVIGNSLKLAEDYNSLNRIPAFKSNKNTWHLTIGREENQITQIENFKAVVYYARGHQIEYDSISIMLFNFGRLRKVKKQFINCFKHIETDVYLDDNGLPWHAYSKYQIDALYSIINLLKKVYPIKHIYPMDQIVRSSKNPTPQIIL